jgi:hypothetical protein
MTNIERADAHGKQAETRLHKADRIWRGRLLKLCSRRYGKPRVPDSDAGRALLTALLRVKLTPDDAIKHAPWIGPTELKALSRRARRVKWADIGRLIGLLIDERDALKGLPWLPVDVTAEEVKRRQAERRKQGDRERKRRKRAKDTEERQDMRNSNKRADAILKLLRHIEDGKNFHGEGANPYLADGGWFPASLIIKEAERCRAFRRPDGVPLRGFREIVHRVLRQLADQGAVKTELRPGPRGAVLYVTKAGKADAFCDGHSVTPGCHAGNARGARVSQAKRTPKNVSAHLREAEDTSNAPTSRSGSGLASNSGSLAAKPHLNGNTSGQWWDDDDAPVWATFH